MKNSEIDWNALLENVDGVAGDLMDARSRRDVPVSFDVEEVRRSVDSMRRTAVFLALSADRLERALAEKLAAGDAVSVTDLLGDAMNGSAFHAFKLKH